MSAQDVSWEEHAVLEILIFAAWGLLALDTLILLAAMIYRDMGDDAAGRGMALGLGLIGLPFPLTGGAALYAGGRADSWPAVIGALLLLALPFLLFFGTRVESVVRDVRWFFHRRTVGRYPDPALRQLARAIETGDLQTMRMVLASHPNLDGRDPVGFDLLSRAMSQPRLRDPDLEADGERGVEAVRLLLDAGMDPTRDQGAGGLSCFLTLCYSRRSDPVFERVFRLFLQHGADANELDSNGQPPIFHVWNSLDAIRALLEHGADIDGRSRGGDTPLRYFVRYRHWQAALLLLDRGADINVRDGNGLTLERALEDHPALLGEPLPDGYYEVKAAIERRRASEAR
jgi:hypothetical protein